MARNCGSHARFRGGDALVGGVLVETMPELALDANGMSAVVCGILELAVEFELAANA